MEIIMLKIPFTYFLTFEFYKIDNHMIKKQIKKRHIEKECSKAQKNSHFGTCNFGRRKANTVC